VMSRCLSSANQSHPKRRLLLIQNHPSEYDCSSNA
jgi:hypothetical protein